MEGEFHLFETLMQTIKRVADGLGLSGEEATRFDLALYLGLIVLIAWGISYLVRRPLIYLEQRYLQRHPASPLKLFEEKSIVTRLSHMVPPIVILILVPLALSDAPRLLNLVERGSWIYLVVVTLISSDTVLSAFGKLFTSDTRFKGRPMKGIFQIVQVILIFLGVIIIVAILVDKSPARLLTGLGAFAAVLMLIFKDSILGFVAGVMLAQNDMVRKGDWITVPGSGADGIVLDVSLNTVKVQNFDNTIVTVPPYSLISGSFQNWRGMVESGGRRIKRAYTIDTNTVHFYTREEVERMGEQIPLLQSFVAEKLKQLEAGKVANTENPAGLVNGTIETNLGLFRAYMTLYLQQHPFVNRQLTLMVRTLAPNDNGLPLEIYCFSSDKVWESYESIQAEIMEHYTAVLPQFGLYAFQNATGRDYINSALLTAGKTPDMLTGLPPDVLHAPKPDTQSGAHPTPPDPATPAAS